jgi:D-lyxose ketol-isomerase
MKRSTVNRAVKDAMNFFIDPDIGRFSEIIEDEAPYVKLVSDK